MSRRRGTPTLAMTVVGVRLNDGLRVVIFFLAMDYRAQFEVSPEYDPFLFVTHGAEVQVVEAGVMALVAGAVVGLVAMVVFVWPCFTPLGQRKLQLGVP